MDSFFCENAALSGTVSALDSPSIISCEAEINQKKRIFAGL
jgi:hypothetical protein